MKYCDMNDMEAIDAIVDEVERGEAANGRCAAGWAMLDRLTKLREELVKERDDAKRRANFADRLFNKGQ